MGSTRHIRGRLVGPCNSIHCGKITGVTLYQQPATTLFFALAKIKLLRIDLSAKLQQIEEISN